jgi:hypothetical protein
MYLKGRDELGEHGIDGRGSVCRDISIQMPLWVFKNSPQNVIAIIMTVKALIMPSILPSFCRSLHVT